MRKLKSILSFLIIFSSFNFILGEFENRPNLSFEIRAIYKGENVDLIGIRGNGLGLNWDASQPLTKTSDDDGIWTYEVKFQTDFQGSKCMECSNPDRSFIPTGDDLEFRFYAIGNNGSESETAMVGNIKRIMLPVSKVSTAFDESPVFTYYPYFFTTVGKYVNFEVDSLTESIGKRDIVVYLPPGMFENPRPIYDRFYMIDLGHILTELFKPALDKIFTKGIAGDAVLIGHGDWKPDPIYGDVNADRGQQLTPIIGDQFACKEGNLLNLCNGCLPPNITGAMDYIYWMTEGGCGIPVSYGGGADENIDFLLGPVYANVNSFLEENYASSITDAQEGTFILGYSFGGLFSCYSAWTRPQSFGGAGCQSSSFWWPSKATTGMPISEFYFVKTVLNTHLDDRQPQKILIDVGEPEQDDLFQMVVMANLAYDVMGVHPMFVRDQNLWLQVYPEKLHTNISWENRIWSFFSLLSTNRN